MKPLASLDTVVATLERGRVRHYSGEPASHREHALQTAAMAQRAPAAPALVAAALLHDIGHLIAVNDSLCQTPSSLGIDDRQEQWAAALLSQCFGPQVTEPIRLHVEAERYRVSVSSDYEAALSGDSRRSLPWQGAATSHDQSAAFRRLPHAGAALRLRCRDALAKNPTPCGLPWADVSLALTCATR